jgi:hypothetical protein
MPIHTLTLNRSPFEGVMNIVRFNWQFYAIAGAIFIGAIFTWNFKLLPDTWNLALMTGASAAFFYLALSLVVSYWIYDCSDLYRFSWLDKIPTLTDEPTHFITIHSGFDETSPLLKARFPNARWQILDFYNPQLNTEISIARARAYRPPSPDTRSIDFKNWNLPPHSIDVAFGILSIHELRTETERTAFFVEARKTLKPHGQFILVEHLRDTANLLAYTVGVFHFFSEKTWHESIIKANFSIDTSFRVTPFVKVFVLKSNLLS